MKQTNKTMLTVHHIHEMKNYPLKHAVYMISIKEKCGNNPVHSQGCCVFICFQCGFLSGMLLTIHKEPIKMNFKPIECNRSTVQPKGSFVQKDALTYGKVRYILGKTYIKVK